MNDKLPCSRVIIGTSQMAVYLGVSRPKIQDYLKSGMPACFLNGKWHFHLENVDLWFKALTRKSGQADIENLTETAD
jgi:excisionase family DNA binding protein